MTRKLPLKSTPTKLASARAYAAKHRKDPAFRAKQAAYMREWYRNPENLARKKASDSEYQKAHLPQIRLRKKKWKSKTYEKLVSSLVENHNGLCDLCQGPPDGRWKKLNIDHCHKTNRFRGMLCLRCNQALGLLRDDPKLLVKAAAYLKKKKGRILP